MKKSLLIILVVVIIVVLGGLVYYFMSRNTAEAIIWDGSYKMDGSLTCTGDVPNLTTVPMNTNVTVSDNKIIDQIQNTVKSFAIDRDGKAMESIEPMDMGQGVTVSGTANYQFSQEDGVYKFTADSTMQFELVKDATTTYSSTCSGSVTGVKQ